MSVKVKFQYIYQKINFQPEKKINIRKIIIGEILDIFFLLN